MKVLTYDSEEEWLEARRGRITGTGLKDILPKARGEGPREGWYQLVADRLAIPHDGENVMDRGHRLEEEAIRRFERDSGKKVTYAPFTLCEREDEPYIAYSPDGMIGMTEDVEVKCRNSAMHIKAILTGKVPSEYEPQIIQGFIVNDKLKTRYMIFYDPRCPKDLFYIVVNRKDVEGKISEYFELERQALQKIAEIENQLTF